MTVAELIARDGNLCELCQTLIDLTLEFPHPYSATVGHIVPETRGGSDESGNLRLEHFDCNMRKRDHLDSELTLPFTPPKPVADVVALLEATERHREGSQKSGRKNVESGQLATIATPESCSKGGFIGGRTTNDATHRANPNYRESRVQGGRNGSREDKVHAGLRVHVLHPNLASENNRRNNHNRCHVRRGITNPNCPLCRKDA
jgi:hypothetical protein